MPAALQPKVFVLRGGSKFRRYGDPYDYSATVTAEGSTALIEGFVCENFNNNVWRDIRDALRKAGFTWAEWDRQSGRVTRRVRVSN